MMRATARAGRVTCRLVLLGALAAGTAARGADAGGAVSPFPPPRLPVAADAAQVEDLLQRGEAALVAGDAVEAQVAFELASRLRHAADIEAGWLRAQMQAGEYRRALAFAAHVAGAHRDTPLGTALYAWLLHVGAQTSVARALLAGADARWPDDAALAWVRTQIDKPVQGVPVTHASAPTRLAPRATGTSVPAHARALGSGLLIDARHALVPRAMLPDAGRLWVRDGLGRTRQAVVERVDAGLDLALLRIDAGFDGTPPPSWAPRDAFPGSAAYAVHYATDDAAAQWPVMALGILGAARAGRPDRWLGLDLPPTSGGAPVFDAAGQLIGLSLADAARARYLPQSAVREFLGAAGLVPSTSASMSVGPSARTTADALYERALRIGLQILAADDAVAASRVEPANPHVH